MGNIKNWIKGTGSYKIGERVIEQGEKTSPPFNITGGWVDNGDGTFTHTVNASNSYLYDSAGLTLNKTYRLTYEILENPNNDIFITTGASFYSGAPLATIGIHTIISAAKSTSPVYFAISSSQSGGIKIGNISVIGIPSLPNQQTGDKYMECTANGTTAIQSKQAYGEWEFDMYKVGSFFYTQFIGIKNIISIPRYLFYASSTNKLYLNKDYKNLLYTTDNYVVNNTWYRIKIARLKSAGVFKDIPTLQTSDCINGTFTSFTGNGRYGFSAISDGSGNMEAGTADEISIVSGKKYLVEFDFKLNSGVSPDVRIRSGFTGSNMSNIETPVNGRNSIVFTATGTYTCILDFFKATGTTTDFEVSGLTIRRIYDADTFAVFIKGGDFGDEYTLVDTTGGIGSNPVVDSTYTESEYMVVDLDAGDTIGNIALFDGTKQ